MVNQIPRDPNINSNVGSRMGTFGDQQAFNFLIGPPIFTLYLLCLWYVSFLWWCFWIWICLWSYEYESELWIIHYVIWTESRPSIYSKILNLWIFKFISKHLNVKFEHTTVIQTTLKSELCTLNSGQLGCTIWTGFVARLWSYYRCGWVLQPNLAVL